jgi:hypothetical protein
MNFKYFIQFDDAGEISCLCKNKPMDCRNNCNEYIVKLSLITRDKVEASVDNFIKYNDKLSIEANKLSSELKKVSNKLRRTFR